MPACLAGDETCRRLRVERRPPFGPREEDARRDRRNRGLNGHHSARVTDAAAGGTSDPRRRRASTTFRRDLPSSFWPRLEALLDEHRFFRGIVRVTTVAGARLTDRVEDSEAFFRPAAHTAKRSAAGGGTTACRRRRPSGLRRALHQRRPMLLAASSTWPLNFAAFLSPPSAFIMRP